MLYLVVVDDHWITTRSARSTEEAEHLVLDMFVEYKRPFRQIKAYPQYTGAQR